VKPGVTDGARVLAGVDEAGLGPLLGSLAIGHCAFLLPDAGVEPWKALRGTVGRRPGARRRLVVTDSKLLFQRGPRGARRLETTVLAFLAQLAGAEEPVTRLGFRGAAAARLPWREELPRLPWACEPASIELTTSLLGRALARAGIGLLDAGVRLVPAAELNASYAETGNKGSTVWERVCEVLERVWALRAQAPVQATVDMLGGRRRYGSLLAIAFPGARVTRLEEREGCSSYALEARDGSGRMSLDFRVGGDRHSFAVALASCLAKYARELEMHAFNAYFARLEPELRPTAGYRGDGRRWLAEAHGAIERSGLTRELLVRER